MTDQLAVLYMFTSLLVPIILSFRHTLSTVTVHPALLNDLALLYTVTFDLL